MSSDGSGGVTEKSVEEYHQQALARVMELLRAGENCMNWEQQLSLPVTDHEMSIILETINGRLENALKGSEDIDGLILVGGTEMIASRCIQAYIYGVQQNVRAALDVMNDAKVLLGECVKERRIPEGYLKGIRYALKSSEVVAIGLSDDPAYMGTVQLEEYAKALEEYSELEHSHLIGLNAIKYYFMWNLSNKSYGATRVVAEKLIEMDPENPEWYGILYWNHKFERQQGDKGRLPRLANTSTRDAPSEIEIQTLRKAFTCPGAEKNITVLTYNLMCLADVFRSKANEARADGIKDLKYGELTFETADHVVEYLKQEAQKIMKLNDNTVRTLFVISRTFSSTLPFRNRDLELADSCISKAVILYPNVSKVNHRKGILCLLKEQYDEAPTYLMKAYRLDPRNVNALIDALYAAVPYSLKEEEEVEKLFQEAVNNEFVTENSQILSHVTFIAGVYKISKGSSAEGVQKLIDSVDLFGDSAPFPHFKHLIREMKRFGWRSTEEFRIFTIKKKLFESSRAEMSELEDGDRKTKIEKILELLKEAFPPSQQGPREGGERKPYRPRQREDGEQDGENNQDGNERANGENSNGRPYRSNERRNQGRTENGVNGRSWRDRNGHDNGDRPRRNDGAGKNESYNSGNRGDSGRRNWRDKPNNRSDGGDGKGTLNDTKDRNGYARGGYQNGTSANRRRDFSGDNPQSEQGQGNSD